MVLGPQAPVNIDQIHPTTALAAAVEELHDQLGNVLGGVVRQHSFINRIIVLILSQLAGGKPIGRVLVCLFRNHRHGGYRFVTGASQHQTRRIGFYIQMVRF
jgi:hypothetical protein